MDFVNQVFMDLLADDGLVVLARYVINFVYLCKNGLTCICYVVLIH